MARWLELADGGSTKYTTRTRVSAVVAGGAMVLASLVAATTTASAEDPGTLSRDLSAAPSVEPSTTVVAGLIVEYAGRSSRLSQAAGAASAMGVSASVTARDEGVGVITFDETADVASAEKVAKRVERLPGVSSVELNVLHQAAALPPGGVPSDQYFSYLHGIWDTRDTVGVTVDGKASTVKLPAGGYGTKAPALWRLTKGSKKITVAVIDTGQTAHPDLDANTVPGYDMITGIYDTSTDDWAPYVDPRDGNGRDADPSDQGDWYGATDCNYNGRSANSSWHGTHVAGTIAAVNDGNGVVGNAPGVRIQHVRVLGKCGGTTYDIAAGITWASGGKVKGTSKNKTPAKVLNLSLAGEVTCQKSVQKAINGARKRGSVVIVAAGNNAADARKFQPANCKNVITVGATDFLGTRTTYSNYGKAVDLSAPGGELAWGLDSDGYPSSGILSTLNLGTTTPGAADWAWYNGTSMAAPAVAGVAALIASLRPKMSAAQLEKAIRGSVSKFPNQKILGSYNCAKKKVCGKGLIDARRAATAFIATPKVITAQVGKKAKVSAKVVAPKAKFSYQWLRNGKKIKGATKKTYTVKKSDLGKKLSVKITVKHSGFLKNTVTTKRVKVGKQTPSVSAKLKKSTIKRSQKAKLTITVKTGAVSKKPTGTLKVTYAGKSKTYKLKASKKGKLTITLPKLKKGTHKIKVKYTPAKSLKKYVKTKSSKTIKLKVK